MIRKYFYGDFGESAAGNDAQENNRLNKDHHSAVGHDWPLWEIFIRSKHGLDHKHVGSLHAADAQMAIENARDVYTRRQEGVSIWVVESKYIHATNPDEAESLYEPANDKIYRHPTFYKLPDEVNYM
jgi:ring-1,2-phenylacetyl-CoA epoxidase subunit PaaB